MKLTSLLATCATAFLFGCASTRIVTQWEIAERGPPCAKLLVVGVTSSTSVRRVFEDEMVRAALARDVAAVPSYALIPEDGPVPDARLAEATRRAAADCVLTTRVVRVAQHLEVVSPPPVWGPPWGFYGWYGGAWGPAYAYPPQVVARDFVYAEVRLYRTKPDALAWAAMTETYAPSDVRQESAAFAQLVFGQLAERKLV